MLRLCLVVGMGLGVVGIVGGCSDLDQRSTLPSDTPTPTSSSASPTPATPEQEIEAAVRAYYAELQRAARTNDTSELRGLTTRQCPCFRPVQVIEGNRKKGRTTPDATFGVTRVRVHNLEGRSAIVEVATSDAAYDVMDSSGTVIGRVSARNHLLDLTVVRDDDGRWIIVNEFDLRGDG